MESIKEQGVFLNPYVSQMDKFAESLTHLAKTFFTLESYKGAFSTEELDEMFGRVTEKVCRQCEHYEECMGEKQVQTRQQFYEILCAVEEYGVELNVELKRKLQKQCMKAPRFLRETLEIFENAKQIMAWNNKVVHNREGYAGQLKSFAEIIRQTTRELDAGIFEDAHLEKRIKQRLKKEGVRMLSSVFYMTEQGKYEIHLTIKTSKGHCVTVKDVAYLVGECAGRNMVPKQDERPIIGEDYCTIACVEQAKYHTLQGVAKIGKNGNSISGDTFLMKDFPGGKKGIALSDGMGAGEEAFKESAMVVEMMEELLEAGFPVKMAVELMNTALVIGREDVKFSTVDVSLFDLYEGTCEFVKAGASTTFIKKKDKVEKIVSTTLPIGVLKDIEIDASRTKLESGDYVIMVTDGVMDALPVGEAEALMTTFINNAEAINPTELARYILGQVLQWGQEIPVDDMTILAIGMWKL